MRLLHGDERLPRYQRLADVLRQGIVDRRWKAGDQLPSENIIADDYGVAPGTARQALALLVDEGMLERHHGRGTFVRRPDFDQSLFRFFRFQSATGERIIPESRILKRQIATAPSSVVQALQLRKNAKAISVSRLRLLDKTPVLAEEIWLPLGLFRKFLDLEEKDIGPLLYPIYDVVCGQVVARAEETLTAEPVSTQYSRLLRLDPGLPVIVIDRLARGYDGKPLEWRRSRGPANRFQYVTEIN